jgi:hypothetical protein
MHLLATTTSTQINNKIFSTHLDKPEFDGVVNHLHPPPVIECDVEEIAPDRTKCTPLPNVAAAVSNRVVFHELGIERQFHNHFLFADTQLASPVGRSGLDCVG